MLAEVLRVQAEQLVSIFCIFHVDAVRSIVTEEVRVFTITTVAEAGVGADLPVGFSQALWVALEVSNVALAALVVRKRQVPRFELSFVQRPALFFSEVAALWALKQVHLTVVVLFEVEVHLVLSLTG